MRRATGGEIDAARSAYMHLDSDIEFDGNAKASASDDGVWVQCWVRVPFDECELCGQVVTSLGDAYCDACDQGADA